MIRAFVAIPLPDSLLPACRAAARVAISGRKVPEENLHLTLVFLGTQETRRLEDLAEALEVLRPPPVTVHLTGLDVLAGFKLSRHLVATVEPEKGLLQLQEAVERAARRVDIALERRRFRPHVTVVRDCIDPTLPPWTAVPEASALSFSLFRTTLKKHGAEYDALATYPLPGAPDH
ncbi:RNA 2',3'-cyclic phosphodiesterase [Silicimonas algicola]|uniref:RNA 2',3'-cyclic phosphodiesterase n=1 Tax=Silicimonas algicola TaxID=1826607 RepID=A0A316GBB1_9RHOB|nr:RNA 2',3'-cyclic phosphodiesterase [Silicimonas algicola]PWK57883.1 2'-5' RNA ligase [Silicimonas algicola]